MTTLYFRTLSKAVNHYTEQGYTFPFDFSAAPLAADKWVIVAVHRFEGFSDPSDNSVLYVMEHKNGIDKGIVVDAYGAGRNERINRFLQNVPRRFPVQLIAPESHLHYTVHEENMRRMLFHGSSGPSIF
ncbi:MAG TPA: hypothetical protein PK228_04470 [Saprospiraceae bacterium]|nr:hypothetical protein [Saprospiraceae bacterium]